MTRRRVAIVGGGVSGLGAAWALHRHADRFDLRLYEAQGQIGGNASRGEADVQPLWDHPLRSAIREGEGP